MLYTGKMTLSIDLHIGGYGAGASFIPTEVDDHIIEIRPILEQSRIDSNE